MKEFQVFDYSIIGEDHLLMEKPCQDASVSEIYGDAAIIAVADGHGAREHYLSGIGSSLAVKVAVAYIRLFVKQVTKEQLMDEKIREGLFSDLKKAILARWRKEVLNDFRIRRDDRQGKEGQDPLRAYGTTLIAVAVTKEYWFALQIGDGNCVEFYDDLKFKESMPYDPHCRGEFTSSLCEKDALDRFRFCFGFQIPEMLLLHTDGIDDSMMDQAQRFGYYHSFVSGFREGIGNGLSYLYDNLNIIAVLGKRDDISMAGVMRKNTIVSFADNLYPIYIRQRDEQEYQRLIQKIATTEKCCERLQTEIDALTSQKQRKNSVLKGKQESLNFYLRELEEDKKQLEQFKIHDHPVD